MGLLARFQIRKVIILHSSLVSALHIAGVLCYMFLLFFIRKACYQANSSPFFWALVAAALRASSFLLLLTAFK